MLGGICPELILYRKARRAGTAAMLEGQDGQNWYYTGRPGELEQLLCRRDRTARAYIVPGGEKGQNCWKAERPRGPDVLLCQESMRGGSAAILRDMEARIAAMRKG
jgi:hypothetical protein